MRLLALTAVFLTFTGWSTWVAAAHGPLGYLTLAAREPWGMQVLIDLVLGLTVAWVWLRKDALARGINPWPYQLMSVLTGSIAVLAYLIHREVLSRRQIAGASATHMH